MRIGLLTGGGDCPGLNPVIRAVTRRAIETYGWEVIGFRDGWKGLLKGDYLQMNAELVRGILHKGGTILGSSRTNPAKKPEDFERVKQSLKQFGIDALVAIGGDDTLGFALKLHREGFQVVGVPKTIDNDISGTDFTFGFNTAVSIVTDCLDRLQTTGESHHRVMVCEVMGRHAGWIAVHSGIAGSADAILIPEIPFDTQELCERVKRRYERKKFALIVVAEGAVPKSGQVATLSAEKDAFGNVRLGGIGQQITDLIEKTTGLETRLTVLGHIQRGGSPTAYDRILATRFGVRAVDAVKNGDFGKMVSLRMQKIITVPLEEGVLENKRVDLELYEIAEVFFG